MDAREKLILGIESSCDETAAAVVADGRRILSSIVSSQIDIHRKYGGVVPELASREHLRKIVPVVREALDQAKITLTDLDAVAVTQGPGLTGHDDLRELGGRTDGYRFAGMYEKARWGAQTLRHRANVPCLKLNRYQDA